MQLNHINLTVPDVTASADFLRRHFGLRDMGLRPTRVMALLTDGHGMVLNLSNFDAVDRVTWPDDFHIGFIRGSRAEVDATHAELVAAGYQADEPRRFHGSWTFYVRAPGGFLVEVQHYEGAGAAPAGVQA